MAKTPSVKATLNDANSVRTVWESMPDFKLGDVALQDFIALHDVTDASQREFNRKRVELKGLKNNRDDKALQLNDFSTRFRFSVRGIYGSDSAQYGQAGGTRSRDRKTPKPRVTTPSA